MNNDSSPVSQDELWLCHLSCMSWSEPDRWIRYFEGTELILGAHITHLDNDDPVRRRVKPGKLAEIADYVTSMGKHEDSRWIFGRMEASDVEFSVQHYRHVRGWANAIDWYFPAGFVDDPAGTKAIRSLFDIGNNTLSAFYGYADTKAHIASKKKESGAVNIQAELIGVFWLSYFDAHYLAFIGKEKIDELQGMNVRFDGGRTLDLGQTPSSFPNRHRAELEIALRPKLFVEPKDVGTKRPGQYALTFDQLR